MHHPVPLALLLNPCSGAAMVWRLAAGGVWAVTAGALGAWCAAWQQAPQWQLALALTAGGVVGVGSAAGVWWARGKSVHRPTVMLAWTGKVWQCDGVEIDAPRVRWDGGFWMLVALQGGGLRRDMRWWVLSAASAGADWHPFRAAVYARVGRHRSKSLETMASGPHLR